MKVLITDSGYISGTLDAARSLRSAGWTVGLGSPRGKGFASRSRAVSRSHVVPSPEIDLDGFVAGLNGAVAEGGYQVILPSGDIEMLALSQERDRINAIVPYGHHEGVVRALDKLDSTEAAEKVGLRVPWTRATNHEGLSEITPERELIVKARRHTFLDRGSGTEFKVATICRGPQDVAARAALIASEGGEGVVQESLSGTLAALSLVCDRRSRVVARMYQVAHATWPEPVGGMARGVTAPIDEDLAGRAEALLQELGWFGLAQIQFILTPDGEHHFIDLNGRLYGSLALATGSGVNLPAMWAEMAVADGTLPLVDALPGVRYQWFEADLKRAMLSGVKAFLPQLVGAVAYARGATHSVWSIRDPLPAVFYTGKLTRRLYAEHIKRRSRGDGTPPS